MNEMCLTRGLRGSIYSRGPPFRRHLASRKDPLRAYIIPLTYYITLKKIQYLLKYNSNTKDSKAKMYIKNSSIIWLNENFKTLEIRSSKIP
jgi:hypothetical protein